MWTWSNLLLLNQVAVISLEPLAGLNWTNVVFGIWPYPKSITISSTGLSIIREYFMAFVIQQPSLHLTTALFGRTYFFQVLKFPGGITIIPPQSAFLLQEVHMLFNFTLNFPIYEVQDKLTELKAQMKSGLLLNSYEVCPFYFFQSTVDVCCAFLSIMHVAYSHQIVQAFSNKVRHTQHRCLLQQ